MEGAGVVAPHSTVLVLSQFQNLDPVDRMNSELLNSNNLSPIHILR